MQKSFNVYTDPSHGWIKVSMKTLNELGIRAKISSYSYMKGDTAYLEEDRDATLLINAMQSKGITPKFKEFHTNNSSKIRNYDSYSIAYK